MTSYAHAGFLCPKCGEDTWVWATASGNSFNAVFYTDGYGRGPMLPQDDRIVVCVHCKAYSWLEDIPDIERKRHGWGVDRASLCYDKRSVFVTGDKFERVLEQELWNSDAQEKYVRVKFWWAWNHRYRPPEHRELPSPLDFEEFFGKREQEVQEFELPMQQEENLIRLLELLDEHDNRSRVTKVEVLRHLGRFDECIALAASPIGDSYKRAVDFIAALASEKKRNLAVLPRNT